MGYLVTIESAREATGTESKSTCPLNNIHGAEDYYNNNFISISGYERLANIDIANQVMDKRYLFVPKSEYVYPLSEDAKKAIQQYHENNRSCGDFYINFIDCLIESDLSVAGAIFEAIFFSKFSKPSLSMAVREEEFGSSFTKCHIQASYV